MALGWIPEMAGTRWAASLARPTAQGSAESGTQAFSGFLLIQT